MLNTIQIRPSGRLFTESRKSIPWQWAAEHGTEITQRQLRVHWRYDVDGFLRGVETLYG